MLADSISANINPSDSLVADSLSADSLMNDSLAHDTTSMILPSQWVLSKQEPVGVLANPAPYNSGTDSMVAILVFAGLVAALLSLAISHGFIVRQIKNFFYLENDRTTSVPDTAAEIGGQITLVFFSCIMIAVGWYHACTLGEDSLLWEAPVWVMLLLYILVTVGYFLFKAILYQFVNWVFFDVKKNEQWNKSQLFVTAMEGVAFAPLMMLMVYGDVPPQIVFIIAVVVVILTKILTFYKCYLIFFGRIGAFLQIILYFCALEMIPLMGLAGIMVALNNNLKINF